MENKNEIFQDLIKTGIEAIKKGNSEKKLTEDENNPKTTEDDLLELKKQFAEKYVQKNINNSILQSTGIVEDYLINEGFWDKLKDKFVYEKLLEKGDLEINTIDEMKQLRKDLEKIKTKSELLTLEDNFFNKNISEQKEEIKKELSEKNTDKNSEKILNINNQEQLKQKIQSELNTIKNCPLTAEMIISSAQKHQVPVEYMMAIMRNDSHYWTAGLWAKTHNPGNVWNTDDWNIKDRSTREKGVDAVAKNLARRIKEYQNIYWNKTPSIKELANNQWPDKKWFIANQWNYKKNNKERMWAYMTDERWWNNVQKISNQLAQNIFNKEEYKLVA